MTVTIQGTPEEIAALAAKMQEQLGVTVFAPQESIDVEDVMDAVGNIFSRQIV